MPPAFPLKRPEIFTPLAPLVTMLVGNCSSGIVPVMFAAVTELALAAKSEIDKIREQSLNLE